MPRQAFYTEPKKPVKAGSTCSSRWPPKAGLAKAGCDMPGIPSCARAMPSRTAAPSPCRSKAAARPRRPEIRQGKGQGAHGLHAREVRSEYEHRPARLDDPPGDGVLGSAVVREHFLGRADAGKEPAPVSLPLHLAEAADDRGHVLRIVEVPTKVDVHHAQNQPHFAQIRACFRLLSCSELLSILMGWFRQNLNLSMLRINVSLFTLQVKFGTNFA